ncbi:hypothetical protein ACVIHD_006549 [Bradyrhizobium embrapense]
MNRPSFAVRSALSCRGRRESRVPIAPMGPEQKGRKLGGRTTGVTGAIRLSLRDGLRLTSCSTPARLGLLVTVFATHDLRNRKRHLPLGRQDHTTSPSASCALVSRAIRVHRISTRVRDDREAPLDRARRADHTLCRTSDKAKYFSRRGLRRRATQWHARVRDAPTAGFPLPLRERVRERGATRRALSVSVTATSEQVARIVPSSIISPGATLLPTLSHKGRGNLRTCSPNARARRHRL